MLIGKKLIIFLFLYKIEIRLNELIKKNCYSIKLGALLVES